MTPTERAALEAWKESDATLTAEGYEQVASALAGKQSVTVYLHPDGRRARIRYANGNRVEYVNPA